MRKSSPASGALERLVDRKLNEAVDVAVEKGAIDSDTLKTLEGLARLVSIQDEARSRALSRPKALGAFASVLILTAGLLFTRTCSEPIDGTFSTTRLTATVEADSAGPVLVDNLTVRSIQLTGGTQIEAPPILSPVAESALQHGQSVRMSAEGALGSLSVRNLTFPPGATLELTAEGGMFYRLSSDRPPLAFSVQVRGRGRIEVANVVEEFEAQKQARLFQVKSAQPIGQAGEFALDLQVPDGTLACFAQQFTLGIIGFAQRPIPIAEGSVGLRRQISAITGGVITFIDFKKKDFTMRVGHPVTFEKLTLELRRACLGGAQIAIEGEGQVNNILIGQGRRSEMPTWLEWMAERQPLALFGSAVLYLFSLFWTVSTWWRRSR